jgi:hypothetical protein
MFIHEKPQQTPRSPFHFALQVVRNFTKISHEQHNQYMKRLHPVGNE